MTKEKLLCSYFVIQQKCLIRSDMKVSSTNYKNVESEGEFLDGLKIILLTEHKSLSSSFFLQECWSTSGISTRTLPLPYIQLCYIWKYKQQIRLVAYETSHFVVVNDNDNYAVKLTADLEITKLWSNQWFIDFNPMYIFLKT